MDVLVLGGTLFSGVHLVRRLLARGHRVTIATRGRRADPFGDAVERVIIERGDGESLLRALGGRHFDAACDNIAYCSNDVKCLLDTVSIGRYVMTSTASVYETLTPNIMEADFDPMTHPLVWDPYDASDYGESKRQAECALFHAYPHISAAALRPPLIAGEDDYTNRLYFYVEHIVKGIPMYVDNPDAAIAFVRSTDFGAFAAHLAEQGFTGSVNAGSRGDVSLADIIGYVETKSGTRALYAPNAQPAPFNGSPSFSLGTQRAESLGFSFPPVSDWIYPLLDAYINRARNET